MGKFSENKGLIMKRTFKGGVLKIPIKGGKIKEYMTSMHGLKQFVNGERGFIFFNPLEEVKDG